VDGGWSTYVLLDSGCNVWAEEKFPVYRTAIIIRLAVRCGGKANWWNVTKNNPAICKESVAINLGKA